MDQLLKFNFAALITLALDFERKRISGAQVCRIKVCRFPQVVDRLRGMAAIALENSQQVVDVAVLWCKIARSFKPLRSRVKVSLAQCEHSPVRPPGRLARRPLRYLGEFVFRVNIIADLQRRQAGIERRNNIAVFLGGSLGKLASRITPCADNNQRCEKKKREYKSKADGGFDRKQRNWFVVHEGITRLLHWCP